MLVKLINGDSKAILNFWTQWLCRKLGSVSPFHGPSREPSRPHRRSCCRTGRCLLWCGSPARHRRGPAELARSNGQVSQQKSRVSLQLCWTTCVVNWQFRVSGTSMHKGHAKIVAHAYQILTSPSNRLYSTSKHSPAAVSLSHKMVKGGGGERDVGGCSVLVLSWCSMLKFDVVSFFAVFCRCSGRGFWAVVFWVPRFGSPYFLNLKKCF